MTPLIPKRGTKRMFSCHGPVQNWKRVRSQLLLMLHGKGEGCKGITSTLLQKCAVTNAHSPHKEMKSNIVNLMVHQESTPQRFYCLQENQEACLQAATNLPSIMRISKIRDDVIPEIDDNSPYTKTEGPTEHISWEEAEVRP